MALLVVRHAHAGKRAAWDGPDHLRPLSARGERQAAALADRIAPSGTKRILSSPAVRCMSTAAPLAARVGLEVEADERLFEGAGHPEITSLLREVEHDDALLCTHGDIVPQLLEQLVSEGMELASELRWLKASTWSVERSEHGWGRGTYVPPPKKTERLIRADPGQPPPRP